MNIDIENPKHRGNKKYRNNNAIWSVLWRFLLVCAIFDGGIYFYFHKIQNITVAEGIRRIRSAIHGDESLPSHLNSNVTPNVPQNIDVYLVNSTTIQESNHPANTSRNISLNNAHHNKQIDEIIYC